MYSYEPPDLISPIRDKGTYITYTMRRESIAKANNVPQLPCPRPLQKVLPSNYTKGHLFLWVLVLEEIPSGHISETTTAIEN